MPADHIAPLPLSARERVALAAFALAPIVFLPGGLNRFVFAKVALAALGCALAAWSPRRGRLPRSAVGLLAAGGVVLVVAASTSASPLGAFLGRAPRYEGVFILPVYVACAASGAWLLGPDRRRGAVPWWLRWLAAGAIAIAFEALLETAGLRPLASNVARPGSLLGNASDEGAIGVLMLGPFTGAAIAARDRWCMAGAVASAAIVVMSASRGALVGVIPVAAVLAVALAWDRAETTAPSRARRRATLLAVAGGLAALVAAAFALPFTRARILDASPLAASTVAGRLLLWQETLRLVTKRFLGVGPSGFLDGIGIEHSREWQVRFGPTFPPDSPHNWVLQAASAGGVLLAVLAVALAALVLWRGWLSVAAQPTPGERGTFAGLLAGVAGYGTALLFHLTSPGTTPLAAFCAGALLAGATARAGSSGTAGATARAGSALTRARRLSRASAVIAGVTMGALVVVLGLAAVAEIPLRSAVDDLAAGRYGGAEGGFELARALRPWDPEVDATAGHALVVAAEETSTTPATSRSLLRAARPWVASELAAYPHSTQALEDAATVAELSGDLGRAARLLQAAAALDPFDPQVLLDRGIVAAQGHHWQLAAGLLTASASIAPSDPATWAELASVYHAEGLTSEAAAAAAHAQRLASG